MSEARPKITVLVHSMNAGGAQKRAVSIANGLARSGLEVEFLAVRPEGEVGAGLSSDVTRAHLRTKSRPWYQPRVLDGVGELAEHLEKSRPDVLLAAVTNVHLIATVAAAQLDHPPKVVLRASRHPVRQIPWSRPLKRVWEFWRRRLDRWLYNKAQLVIAVSEDVGKALRELLDQPDHCVTLPNPVVSDQFLESLRREPMHPWLGASGNTPVVLAVGRLVWQKGFDCLLTAFAKVAEQHEARLIILGEGNLRRPLERQIEALGLEELVSMPGHVDEVGPWMARASVLVSSSNFEGSPGVVIEALAAGCPVVATNCPGGPAELLEGRKAGLLVPRGDADALARGISSAITQRWEPHELRAVAVPFLERRATARYSELLGGLSSLPVPKSKARHAGAN